MEAETGVIQPQGKKGKEYQQLPEAGRGKETVFLLRASGGSADLLIP